MLRIGMMATTLVIGMMDLAVAEHPGKVLHDEANCMKCHESLGYNSEKTIKMKIDSQADLVKAVSFCNNNLNVGWFEDEVEQVADYLNQKYYHLSQ